MASEIVTLGPGESKEVVFTVTPPEPGHYTVAVNGLAGSFDVIPIVGQTLWGYITNPSGNPIPNACVEIGAMAVATGADGGYEAPGIPVTDTPTGIYGVYDVTISAVGYEAQTHRISVIPGDAYVDGVIDLGDVIKVERIIKGLDPWTPSADANQDGVVDLGDVIWIKRIIKGLEQPLATERFDVELIPEAALYELTGGTWEAPMPFEASSMHYFDMMFKNTSSQRYDYSLTMSFPESGSSTKSGSAPPGMGVSLRSNWYMPYRPGTYDMTLEITIDGVFIGEFVVSTVEVV